MDGASYCVARHRALLVERSLIGHLQLTCRKKVHSILSAEALLWGRSYISIKRYDRSGSPSPSPGCLGRSTNVLATPAQRNLHIRTRTHLHPPHTREPQPRFRRRARHDLRLLGSDSTYTHSQIHGARSRRRQGAQILGRLAGYHRSSRTTDWLAPTRADPMFPMAY